MGASLSKLIYKNNVMSLMIASSQASCCMHIHSPFPGAFKCFFKKSKLCVQMREGTYRIRMHNSARSRDKTSNFRFMPAGSTRIKGKKPRAKTLLVGKKAHGKEKLAHFYNTTESLFCSLDHFRSFECLSVLW